MIPGTLPEWRLVKANELSKLPLDKRIARSRVERFDQLTQDLAVVISVGAKDGVAETSLTDDQIQLFEMYQVYVQPSYNVFRAGMESYILAGASDSEISQRLPFSESQIDLYERAFFNVRPFKSKPQTIVLMVFRNALHLHGAKDDKRSLMHKLGFVGGITMVDNHLTSQNYAKVQEDYMALLEQMVEKKSTEAMLVQQLDSQSTQVYSQIAFSRKDRRADERAKATNNDKSEVEKAVSKFFGEMPLSVADPTDPANLALPARESRASEITHDQSQVHV